MKKQKILVAYGSKHRAAAGIGKEIGPTLHQDGFEAAVVPAADAHDVSGYDAVGLRSSLIRGISATSQICGPRMPALTQSLESVPDPRAERPRPGPGEGLSCRADRPTTEVLPALSVVGRRRVCWS
ncbi:hypothetical protein KCMC57_up05060 [Kitasatospora sp. CMC57]|uniref:Flavodoxin-like domain-containing protein n=1 Tax=Kitasatospora sp. CMC57 TaxID=3231513 RepID=A0AB33JS57_9ACTN